MDINIRYLKIKSKCSIIRAGFLVIGFIFLSEMAFGAQATASLIKHSSLDQRLVVSVNFENEPLAEVLHELAQRVDAGISYKTQNVPDKMVTYRTRNVSIYSILAAVLKDTGLYATLSANRKVILIKKRYLQKSVKQQSTISGTVTDAGTGETLPGVNIQVKGTTTGTSTDAQGQYELTVESLQDTLVFSFVGYQTKEVPIKERTTINIALKSQVISGQELVVTALGVKEEKRSLSYSTEQVNTENIAKSREINVVSSLQGKVAGLTMNSSGSGLGSENRVVLRGNRSISGDSQPLYVVDGVPIRGSINNISPDNIASINVLKGANAAALYGSEAQNGVIIVQTLTGEAGKVKISLNNNFMTREPIQYMDFQYEYGQGNGGVYEKSSEYSWGPKMEGQMVDNWSLDPTDAGTQYAFTPQPNNKNDVYQRGYNMANNFIASLGTEGTQMVFAYTLTKGIGVLPGNKLRRHNASVRVNSQLTDRLNLDSKIDYSNQLIDNKLSEGRSNFNPNRQIFMIPPNIRTEQLKKFEYVDANGLKKQNWYNPSTTTGANPYWDLYRDKKQETQERVIALASLTYDITDELNLMIRGAYDGGNSRGDEKLYNDTFTRADYGRYSVDRSNALQYNGDFLLSYVHDFTEDWNISAHFGGSLKKNDSSSLNTNTGDALLVPNFFAISNTNKVESTYTPGSRVETQSLYAFTKIGWKDALYLNLTGRNDWSSTLPADSRSYFYPSVGLSAILSDLIPSFPDFFSFVKVRASLAKVGSSAPAYRGFRQANFQAGGNNGYISLSNVLPNPDLKPEETVSTELGLNVRILEDRVGLDLSAYKTNTRNQLFTIALPIVSGATSYFTNGGDVQNKGLEIQLTTTPVRNRNFNWNFDINLAVNRNLVTKISDERPRIIIGGDPYLLDLYVEQGKPYGQMYSRGFQRDDQGRVIIGNDGLPLITPGSTVNIGNINPDWTGSISSTFSYKNISASFLIDHRQGGDLATMTNAILARAGQLKQTLQGREGGLIFGKNLFSNETAVLEDGTPNNIKIDAESFWSKVGGEAAPTGEAFTHDATRTILREATIGYALPQSILNKLAVSKVKISLVGRNLFYIYKASDNTEPDVTVGTGPGSQGFQNFAPPIARTFGFNLDIDF